MATVRRRKAAADPADPIEVERRINEVQDRIVASQWLPGVTARELAAKWGLEPATVNHYYTEARRALVRGGRQHGHVFEQRLEAMVAVAMSKGDVATAMKGLALLREWRSEARRLSGHDSAGGVGLDVLGQAARDAADKNMRDD